LSETPDAPGRRFLGEALAPQRVGEPGGELHALAHGLLGPQRDLDVIREHAEREARGGGVASLRQRGGLRGQIGDRARIRKVRCRPEVLTHERPDLADVRGCERKGSGDRGGRSPLVQRLGHLTLLSERVQPYRKPAARILHSAPVHRVPVPPAACLLSRLGKSDDVGSEGPPTPQEGLLDVVLPASFTAPGMSRRSLEEHDALAQSRRLDDVKLLVSELVTNAVRHAPHEPGDTVRLSVRMEGELVHVEVCDR
jgi:hypothetical protein